ncbi:hypothetical protein DS2_06096 [Catenovulum agarivorans DS-2]|uniref:DUF3016 domain-containing protein n=1 Tax=Catenovulum agarivorans DS-2 TaxID=1328313 RepID=W7QD65_9ALTE|nr:DUF3016 domain-containing protein [Catenovulum agarivorans]EWH10839.1 hypothetical protein DS2_06096 [Catenovulum agarivorans DS-2]
MIKLLKYSVISLTLAYSQMLNAAQLEVEWQNPEEYTDINEGNTYTRSAYQQHVFNRFEQFLTHRAAKLPDEQKLKLVVTDLDLAGETRFNFEEIRVIKEPYIPRMKFSYQLFDSQGNELQAGDADLKNMSMTTSYLTKPLEDQFKYEFSMLNNWFKKTFTDSQF